MLQRLVFHTEMPLTAQVGWRKPCRFQQQRPGSQASLQEAPERGNNGRRQAAGGRNRPSSIPRITCAGALKEGAVRVFNRQFTLVFNLHFTFFAKLFIETEQTQAILSQKYHQRSLCANMYLYMYFLSAMVIFGHFLAFWSLWTGASWKKMQETDTSGNYVKKIQYNLGTCQKFHQLSFLYSLQC